MRDGQNIFTHARGAILLGDGTVLAETWNGTFSPELVPIPNQVAGSFDPAAHHLLTLRLRNAAVPLVEVCRRLTGTDLPQINAAMHPLFRDVTDHIRSVQEKVDSLREVLAFAFEASLLVGQSQETAISKKLAAWAAILAVPTALAGIYGMNFVDMPELKLPYAYPTILIVIALICSVLYWRFRKNGWL